MKKIALLCVICLLLTVLPGAVSAEGVLVEVTDVAGDIVTVSGSAPNDTIVTVMILNPGMGVGDIASKDFEAVQYMGSVYSKDGEFECEIKMNTGSGANKSEGAFTVLVSLNGKLIYSDKNFIFYSNDTKTSYVNDLKNCSKSELLAEEGSVKKIENIFETYSLSSHELYVGAGLEGIADTIVAQTSRSKISLPTDAAEFLLKALVLNAFKNGSSKLVTGETINYSDVWAKSGDSVHKLYADYFVNDLSPEGKKAVISEMLNGNYKVFGDELKLFEEVMLYHLIKNNAGMGSGHIETYITGELKNEYKAAGFDAALISSVTNNEEKITKLNSVLNCNASTLATLAAEYKTIMTAVPEEGEEEPDLGGGSLSGGGSSGGGGGGRPAQTVPSGGSGEGFVGGTEAPTPDATPDPGETPDAPVANHPFKDMAEASWANEAVEYLFENKIVNGRTETEFVPSATVTRAELVKMICEALKVADAETAESFADVSDSDWFAAYVKKAAAAGIVKGDGGAFNPNGGVTREDAALIIFRALGLEVNGEITFTDKDAVSDYAKDAIASMVNAGLISGMGDGTFAPKTTLTRAQAAQLIFNAITKGGSAQ